jgi:hypothetical protein
MRWDRVPLPVRLACFLGAAASFAMAWRLTVVGRSGAEDVPPPLTLLAGLTGFAFLAVALLGRSPRPRGGGGAP